MDLPTRKTLPHDVPLWVNPQNEIYFITVNCVPPGLNQLAQPAKGLVSKPEEWPYVYFGDDAAGL